MKRRIYVQFGGGLGSMSRIIPIIEGLNNEDIEFKYSGFPVAQKYMEDLGVSLLDSKFRFDDKIMKEPCSKWKTPEQFWQMMGYNDFEWIKEKVSQLVKLLNEYRPHLVITDMGILAWMAAKICKIPLVTITQSCYHPEREFDAFRWLDIKLDNKNANLFLKDWINDIFEEYEIPQIEKFEEIFTGDLTLIASYPEIDKLKNNCNGYNTKYVGPILYDNSIYLNDEELNKYISDNTIFCYTGRFYDHVGNSGEYVFRKLLECSHKINNFMIISVGSCEDLEIAEKIATELNVDYSKVKIVDFVPMHYAYANAKLIIHHGGHGSCLGQIQYEKASLILPTHSEREYNARMFEKLHFSKVLSSEELCSESIERMINELLTDKSYKKAIEEFHKQVLTKNNMGVDAAIKYIKSML
jgi:UDP:flavonoid glycosyltransferase YjiC (YdhE family)